MSWVAIGVGVGTSVVGGVSQNQANKKAQGAANAANKQAGYVDVTTTRRGDPRSDSYRDDGMLAAYNALFGSDYRGGDGQQLRIQGDPRAAAPPPRPGGPPANMTPKQAKQYAADQARIAAAKGKKKGGGTTAPAPATAPRKFDGMSGETDEIRRRMMEELPEQNADMYGVSENFLTDTLTGEERNPYREEAAGAARAISVDPRLERYLDVLEGRAGGGAAKVSGQRVNAGTVGRAYSQGGDAAVQAYSGGGGAGPSSPNMPAGATATGTDAALRKLVAGEDPAGWAAMEEAISRRVNEGRAEQIRQLKANAVGSGFYGGSVYEDAMEGAIARGDQELADSLSGARFGAYQNALGLGTQYDLGMADLSARERMNAANASASAGAAGADIASREKLAMLGMWGDALGMGQQGRAASAGALGDLAGLTSEDQRFAVSGVNDLAAGRRGDLGLAGDLSLGADSTRRAYIGDQRNERVGMAGVNLGRSELGFAREQMYDPLNRLGQYAGLLNTFYGGLGSETTQGRDMRSGAPASFQPGSVAGAALSGAGLGGQIGMAFRRQPAAGTGGG